jgi:Putative transposase.
MRSKVELADILHGLGNRVESLELNNWQLRTLSSLSICRTHALGGHVDACEECGVVRVSYNSCRNRHCPKCQGSSREKWIEARIDELLPVPYFHVVFTIPPVLNELCMQYPERLYGLLFKSAWETLHRFAQNKRLKTGMIAVLHTWGQNLSFHPHLHCIVPGGGTDKQNKWRNLHADGKFLFPVKAMSKVFRAKYVSILR